MTRSAWTAGDDLRELTRSPWRWEWVPALDGAAGSRSEWASRVTAQFADWTREGLERVREVWPDEANLEFPLTPEFVGHGVCDWLLERADRLPPWARLAWGAVFIGGRPRWAPVPVVVEFCEPLAEDPDYLMETVGARGTDADAREAVVDYVTTSAGDGLRVFALCRSEEGAAYARVQAALRADVPGGDGAPAVSADVLLTTMVLEMGLMAVIGHGMELLMRQIAAECVPADGGPVRLGFTVGQGGAR